MIALACSDASPPFVASLLRYCNPDCHFACVNPGPAPPMFCRPSCTASAAVSRKAATAAVATGRCFSRIIWSQRGWSTVTLNFAAIGNVLQRFLDCLAIALRADGGDHQSIGPLDAIKLLA